jgi:hypothetical protein
MRTYDSDFVRTAQVRAVLVVPGDIRGEIEFQNDINCLLARLGEKIPPLEALGWFPSIPAEERRLKLIPGGYPRPSPPNPAIHDQLDPDEPFERDHEPFDQPAARRSGSTTSLPAVLAAIGNS